MMRCSVGAASSRAHASPLPIRAAAAAARAGRKTSGPRCSSSSVGINLKTPASAAASLASSRGAAAAPSSGAISSLLLSRRAQRRGVSSIVPTAAAASAVAAAAAAAAPTPLPPRSVSVVLLCGGSGKRMGASIPKQYLELCGRPIVAWSLRLFAAMAEVRDVVVVCEPEYRDLISKHWGEACERAAAEDPAASVPELKWAPPGAERQDSVQSGLARIDPSTKLAAVHDSARPLTAAADVRRCLSDANDCGAAVLGVPVKPTIKEVNDDGTVARTLVRARLWEVQTPQVIEPALLRRGFAFATERNLEVTDDVSVVELLGETVRITQGSYTNIKVTTPDDLSIAERFLVERGDASREKVGAAAAAA